MESDRPEDRQDEPSQSEPSQGDTPQGDQTQGDPGEGPPTDPSAEGERPVETPAEEEAPAAATAPGEDGTAGEGGTDREGEATPAGDTASAGESVSEGETATESETAAESESVPDGETAPEGDAAPEQDSAPPEPPAPPTPRRPRQQEGSEQPEVVPGADLEPDLVLDEPARAEQDEYGDAAYAARYAEPEGESAEEPTAAIEGAPASAEASAARTPMELAADARYQATGKRKTSVARVILKPGSGTYTVNGRTLEQFFPRRGLQTTVRQPLSAAGYESRMDVVARLHGGGVSSQAGALRHGVARALVEADPSLREDLKRRGYLTRDPRAKERRKAGLKKARKRPQFSKR